RPRPEPRRQRERRADPERDREQPDGAPGERQEPNDHSLFPRKLMGVTTTTAAAWAGTLAMPAIVSACRTARFAPSAASETVRYLAPWATTSPRPAANVQARLRTKLLVTATRNAPTAALDSGRRASIRAANTARLTTYPLAPTAQKRRNSTLMTPS